MSFQQHAIQTDDGRLERLHQWLESLFGANDFELRPASADASFRRYFRVSRAERTWIAMDAPPDKEDLDPFIRVAAILAEVGVNAPRVLEQNLTGGFLLLTDLGWRTYLKELLAGGDADSLYADAISALVRIQSRGHGHAQRLPPYDESLLRRELNLFSEWFCGRHLSLSAADEFPDLDAVYARLIEAALEQPTVFVHRDYHSRNLMVGDGARFGANPGILDFQDAVLGPVTYDLVSLLRDCYIDWPAERVAGWVKSYYRQAGEQGLKIATSESEFARWFDLMGIQRHLKAIGIFARLAYRDGKPVYLKDVPRTLGYVSQVSERYPEFRPFRSWLERCVSPAMARLEPVSDA